VVSTVPVLIMSNPICDVLKCLRWCHKFYSCASVSQDYLILEKLFVVQLEEIAVERQLDFWTRFI